MVLSTTTSFLSDVRLTKRRRFVSVFLILFISVIGALKCTDIFNGERHGWKFSSTRTTTVAVDFSGHQFNSSQYVGDLVVEQRDVVIPVLGVTVINHEDLLVKMLRSVDHKVETLVIFHNGDSDEETNRKMRHTIESIQLKQINLGHDNIKHVIAFFRLNNLGFSAGVNQIILSTPHARFWLIVNNDVEFHPGILQEVAQTMASDKAKSDNICLWGLVGDRASRYSSFVLTPRAVRTIGIFDENFWPAYSEDCDYTARLVRADCPIKFEPDSERMASHVTSASWKKASSKSDLRKRVKQNGKGHNNYDYLIEKWGMNICKLCTPKPPYMDRSKGLVRPFDNLNAELSSWSVDMKRRHTRKGPQECVVCNSS